MGTLSLVSNYILTSYSFNTGYFSHAQPIRSIIGSFYYRLFFVGGAAAELEESGGESEQQQHERTTYRRFVIAVRVVRNDNLTRSGMIAVDISERFIHLGMVIAQTCWLCNTLPAGNGRTGGTLIRNEGVIRSCNRRHSIVMPAIRPVIRHGHAGTVSLANNTISRTQHLHTSFIHLSISPCTTAHKEEQSQCV